MSNMSSLNQCVPLDLLPEWVTCLPIYTSGKHGKDVDIFATHISIVENNYIRSY